MQRAYLTTNLTTRAESRLTQAWIGTRGPGAQEDLNIRKAFESRRNRPCTRSSLFFSLLNPHFVVIAPKFYSMARSRSLLISTIMSVAVIRLASSLAGEQRLVSSSLCVAQFRAGALRTAVLTFILMQDRHKSFLFSGVLRTAIATVSSR